jgi:hypothetical protein
MIEKAREAVRRLVSLGQAPDAINPAACTPYEEAVAVLIEAHSAGGLSKVRQVWTDLCNAQQGLAALLASDPDPIKTSWTVGELLNHTFMEPQWAVPDLIPEGLAFLAGKPKVGKSWFALQIASAVGSGGRVLERIVQRRKVLYLALEDSPRRLKKRLERQQALNDAEVTFRFEWKALGEGGLVDLHAEIERGGYQLVIIDTLSRAVGRADQMDPAEMTIVLGNLQQLAIRANLTILMIDHHRKSANSDGSPIDDIMGSTAKAAVADAALGLFKEQGKKGAILKVQGRDLEDRELALDWDPQLCCWQLLGDADEVRANTLKADVLLAVHDLMELEELPTTTNIASRLQKDPGNVSRAISDLVQAGKLQKGKKISQQQPYHLA